MRTIGVLYKDKDGVFLNTPFTDKSTYDAYKLFSQIGFQMGFRVLFAKPEWYAHGRLKKCWDLEKNTLKKDCKIDIAFDRVLSFNKKHFLFMQNLRNKIRKRMSLVNHPEIERIANDKYATYTTFPEYVPETQPNISLSGKVVVKPRYGGAGRSITIINANRIKKLKKDYIVQKFIDTSKGMPGFVSGPHDFRVVILNGKILDSFFRIPGKGYISNISKGGKLLRKKGMPKDIQEIAKNIDQRLAKYGTRFYSIDFIHGKKPLIVELNAHPGFRLYASFNNQNILRNIIIQLFEEFKKI